ncbi:hypothetical protein Ddc_12272 [Ditylenchus destructor]|nr:hypothetical protein Ddc_12272 [Ditylenchus destructor]
MEAVRAAHIWLGCVQEVFRKLFAQPIYDEALGNGRLLAEFQPTRQNSRYSVFRCTGFCRVGVLDCVAWASPLFRQSSAADLALYLRVPRVLTV